MDIVEFKSQLIKAQRRMLRHGFMFFFFAAVVATLVIIFVGLSDRSGKVGMIFIGMFLVIGLVMMIKSLNEIGKIRSGEHGLIKAIENKLDYPDYVVWIYQLTMVTKHEMIEHKSRHASLIIRNNIGKSLVFMPNSEEQVHDLIDFLSSEFPNALVGFSEENRKKASKIVGKELA